MSRIAFVLEHSLGHATHAQNLKHALQQAQGQQADVPSIPSIASIDPVFIDLDFADQSHLYQRLPLVRSNWSARASLGARLALNQARKTSKAAPLSGALFHTQVTSLFSAGLMRHSLPSVVSLDATPTQIDQQGEQYGHRPSSNARVEAIKRGMTQKALDAAKHLVTWSNWAKDSLVADYGIPEHKVTVVPPGVDKQKWSFPERERKANAPVRFLFVGGDFSRKGGDTLLSAWQRMPASLRQRCHLDIVTKAEDVPEGIEGVTVHRGVTPNSPKLLSLFAAADTFAFPTRGDCLPLAILEALMAGLPVITTTVGALPEAVAGGEAGRIVPVGDVAALSQALEELASDAELRQRLSVRARCIAVERFDADTNYRQLIQIVQGVAEGQRSSVLLPSPVSVAGRSAT